MGFQDEFKRRVALRQDQGNGNAACHSRDSGNPGDADHASESGGKLRHHLHADDAVENDGDYKSVRPEPLECSKLDPSTGSGRTDGGDAPTRTIRHDGWHPDIRVKFLEALAHTGNVGAAAMWVQRTRQSAYALKRRDVDFARAWLAALVLAREAAQDALQERAIEGVEEEIFYHGEVVATRRRYDSRLLLALLARLDKVAEQ
ncbi:MAG: hypothetical protein ABJH21_16205, partial [Parasphingorhabdus sp.]